LVATDKLEVIGINDIGSTITPGPGSVNESQLGSDSVSTIKLQDNAITNAKMTDDAVGLAELSATGTPSSSTFLRGDNAWASADAGLTSVQTFTSSGTWTKPSGITKVIVEVQGAGSSGRADGSYFRGAGGGYSKKFIDVSSISSATITVGAGGAAQSANGGAGNAGGNSIWSDGTNTVTGGGGSAHNTVGTGALGGVATGGDLNINGQGSGTVVGSENGNSFLGYGDWCPGSLTGSNQETIPGYGGGGGNGYTSYPSRPGGNGIVIVTEYK
jgi:hypothetical protein